MIERGADLEGTVIADRYLMTQYLDEGNFGWVFRAEQQLLGQYLRTVAMKVTKLTDISLQTAREVFQEPIIVAGIMEATDDPEVARRLVHVHDLGLLPEHDSRGFIVMEFVGGGTLESVLQDIGMNQWDCLEYAVDICAGMAAAHAHSPQIVHRDLKPDNLLLTRSRQLKIGDFGLAARVLEVVGYTPGVAGTTLWMAPETLRHTDAHASPQSDVYSIGLILYRILTGRHPFEHLVTPRDLTPAQEAEWLYGQRMTLVIAPPSRNNATVTRAMDDLVMCALDPEERARFTDAGQMLQALQCLDRQHQDPRHEVLREAEGAEAAGDLDAAASAFDRCWDLNREACDSTAFRAVCGLARCRAAHKDWREALRLYRDAEQINERCVALKSTEERRKFFEEVAECASLANRRLMEAKYRRLAEGPER